MLADLSRWWLQQMADLLPRPWLAGPSYADAAVLRVGGLGLSAALRRRGVETALGHAEPGGVVLSRLRGGRAGPVLLALPPSALLEQEVTLPLAAERNLGAVLGYELDRLTPFAAEDLFWTWRVQTRDHAAGRVRVRLLLVPKSAAADGLAALSTAGLRLAAIEVEGARGAEYLPLSQPGGRRQRGGKAMLPAMLCGALAVALAALPILRQERAIMRIDDVIANLRPRVAAVEAMRRRIAESGSGSDLFAAESGRTGTPLRALAAVTAALPDDTFLTAFSMRQGVIALSGRSAAAVKLIGSLSAEPDLRNPAFDAPVLRTSQDGVVSDQFSIRVTLAP